jgi:hypothetical protein
VGVVFHHGTLEDAEDFSSGQRLSAGMMDLIVQLAELWAQDPERPGPASADDHRAQRFSAATLRAPAAEPTPRSSGRRQETRTDQNIPPQWLTGYKAPVPDERATYREVHIHQGRKA